MSRRTRPTLAEIAAEAGVSLPTVSKVVNGHADVAASTRARIEQLLGERNYRHPGVRRGRHAGLIDIVFAGLDSPWAVEILRGVEDWCSAHGVAAVVSSVRHGSARPASWTSALASHDTDGVLLVTSELTADQLRQLREEDIPLVVIDPVNLPEPDLPGVGATNWSGGLAATEHLIGCGHTRIAAIGGPENFLCSVARIDGYRSALERAGLKYDPALVRHGDFEYEGGFLRAESLLDLAEPPTAIFAGSDQQALGVYEAARQRGLRIPQDLSVVGFDDLPMSRWSSPPLTTIRQPLAEMGRLAAEMLGSLVEGLTLSSHRMEIATELVVRGSTARPPASQHASATITGEPWRDPALPVADRLADLLARMTLAEKQAQLVGVWIKTGGEDDDQVAPMQGEFADTAPLDELITNGVGQLTRVFGTAPVTPAAGVQALAKLQQKVMAASRFGIPAIAHEECLTGLVAWSATIFPTPLAWGASFDPDAVREMAAAIGQSMRAIGVHQGLAPVLDVSLDPRWGRVEETIGADPYLVSMIGTAYVQGLEASGIIATLKHFAGYSASRAGRNMAPADIGPRALADVILPPFEMAIRDGGARAVMPSYTAVDDVPSHADDQLLTTRLRGDLGFTGTVVSDYFGVSFLETVHGVAGSPADAAAMALMSGVDTELPHRRCYAAPLTEAVRSGAAPEGLVDRAAARVLRQKFQLGLLDPGWAPDDDGASIDLDPDEHRQLARQLAEESVVLLANDQQVLPLRATARLAVVGPLADDPQAGLGCYTFPRHVGYRYPEKGTGVRLESLLTALRKELPDNAISYARGCDVRSPDGSGIADAAACAAAADVAIVVLGDEAGLFGRGTSGEGCDAPDLRLPGVQQELLDAVLQTGVPVVLVLITGRPYAIGGGTGQLAAAIQSFFPGEEGAGAIARVLSGRVTPSGKLPIEMPAIGAAQPAFYLRTRPAEYSTASATDPMPLFPFGHGLSYTSFQYSQLSLTSPDADGMMATDGATDIGCTVRNTGERAGAEVVQLYLRDPVAQVTRPVQYLAGFGRVALEPGQSRRVTFRLHADRTSFVGRSGHRVVESGRIDVLIGSSATDIRLTGTLTMHGPERVVGPDRVLSTPVVVSGPGTQD